MACKDTRAETASVIKNFSGHIKHVLANLISLRPFHFSWTEQEHCFQNLIRSLSLPSSQDGYLLADSSMIEVSLSLNSARGVTKTTLVTFVTAVSTRSSENQPLQNK